MPPQLDKEKAKVAAEPAKPPEKKKPKKAIAKKRKTKKT